MKIALVGESSVQGVNPSLARDCYTSELFIAAKAYCDKHFPRWFILSGEHAVLEPDSFVQPPAICLGQLPERVQRAWPACVLRCLTALGLEDEEFLLFAGEAHAKALMGMLNAFWPLRGLTEQDQVAWFASQGRC
jgi:hypothetical protein